MIWIERRFVEVPLILQKGIIIFKFNLQLLFINSLKSLKYILSVIIRLNKPATPLRLLFSSCFHVDFT